MNHERYDRKRRNYVYGGFALALWVITLLWMSMIFGLSAQTGEESGRLSLVIAGLFANVRYVIPRSLLSDLDMDFYQVIHILRKCAHFMVYFFLGILLASSFGASKVRKNHSILLTLMICILYAISDEVHQMFVPGRGPAVRDVMIDTAGAFTGVGLYLVANKLLAAIRMRSGRAVTGHNDR